MIRQFSGCPSLVVFHLGIRSMRQQENRRLMFAAPRRMMQRSLACYNFGPLHPTWDARRWLREIFAESIPIAGSSIASRREAGSCMRNCLSYESIQR